MINVFTIDVEDWFHILGSPATPTIEQWPYLQSRIERNLEWLLELLDEKGVRATLFWLGWIAERHKSLLRRCHRAGHEIASHGYSHILVNKMEARVFKHDLIKSRKVLEDTIGDRISGFRAPGFGINDGIRWPFDIVREAGYEWDSSTLALAIKHSTMPTPQPVPYVINTKAGALVEIPVSEVRLLGLNLRLFGGGYFRASPLWLIRWGISQLHKSGSPVVVYIHPRDIDTDSPCLPLGPLDRFKFHVNVKTTVAKVRRLLVECEFGRMRDLVANARGTIAREQGR